MLGESPDMAVGDSQSACAIECVSANLIASKDDADLVYKIKAAVRAKSKKPYVNHKTALWIDYTNILFRSAVGRVLRNEHVEEALSEVMDNSGYGGLISSALVFDLDSRRFVMPINHNLSSVCDPVLKSLVDGLFARNEVTLRFAPVLSV